MKTLCEAVRDRINFLLKEHNMNPHNLTLKSGVLTGTLWGILSARNKSVDFMTIIKLAGGFEMSLAEFVDDSLFNEDNLKVD